MAIVSGSTKFLSMKYWASLFYLLGCVPTLIFRSQHPSCPMLLLSLCEGFLSPFTSVTEDEPLLRASFFQVLECSWMFMMSPLLSQLQPRGVCGTVVASVLSVFSMALSVPVSDPATSPTCSCIWWNGWLPTKKLMPTINQLAPDSFNGILLWKL